MAPRRYTLGKRGESAAATREAILDAAMAAYMDAGSVRAPLTAIAERADVARGTILHHFGSADGVIDAVIGRLISQFAVPDADIFEGAHDTEARVRVYVRAMVAYFRRTTTWWRVFESEMDRPLARAGEAAYWASLSELQSAALGPDLAADIAVQQVLGGILHPGTVGSLLWALEQAGMTAEAADRVVEDLVIGYLEERGGKGG
ncbi:MAG TPA: TetR/AcrR family transcriptional regulator [Candidatus Limnocylindrales bacterium]|nr:TetR/AcrR family transcriptional regulator [Candidatus Limnocylindrales bacterium]